MSEERSGWRFLPAREHRFLCAFLFAQVLLLTHFVHEAYALAEPHMQPGTAACFFGACGQKFAPQAYRVGVEAVGTFLLRITHTQHPSIVAAALDFSFWLPALFLLSGAAVSSMATDAAGRSRRLLTLAIFLAAAQFALLWVVPWQRSETAPSAFFVAAVMWWVARSSKSRRSVALLLALAAWQSFVRADVTAVAGLALLLWALADTTAEALGPRRQMQVAGACMIILGVAAQALLQFVVYPGLSYEPGVRRLQLLYNLRHAHQLEVASIALLPFVLLLSFRPRKRDPLRSLALTLAALYLPLWLAFGVLQEVRLFVPFLLPLAVVAARGASAALLSADA